MSLVMYNMSGDPTERGIYACRVPNSEIPGLFYDKFLLWFDGKWFYPSSDQTYRCAVSGWIGPLQRRMSATPVKPA